MPEFLTYTKVHTHEEAQELTTLLTAADIEFVIEAEKDPLDKAYVGESFDPYIAVKIPQHRFEEVNKLMLQQAQSQLDGINPDYYLFSFTDSELLDVLNKPDEWNHLDQALAQKLLADRKVEIPAAAASPVSVTAFKPYHLEIAWVIAEYLVSVAFAFAGILIGAFTLLAYKALRDGTKVKMYDKDTRTHATIMIAIGVVRTVYGYRDWFF